MLINNGGKRAVQYLVASVAVLFGIMTLFAGGRVLRGADPGYVVFRPLLLYNTAMGAAYVVAGAAIGLDLTWGKWASGVIFLLNLLVLGGILVVYGSGGAVAVESLGAMTFRTLVWLVIFLAASRLARSTRESSVSWSTRDGVGNRN